MSFAIELLAIGPTIGAFSDKNSDSKAIFAPVEPSREHASLADGRLGSQSR